MGWENASKFADRFRADDGSSLRFIEGLIPFGQNTRKTSDKRIQVGSDHAIRARSQTRQGRSEKLSVLCIPNIIDLR